MASAQVKSAILLAGMFADGTTTVRQPAVTRDHTERLFRHFGVPCTVDGLTVGTCGPALPVAHDLTVPADISSMTFWMVAAASRPGSRLTLRQVGLNKTRNAVISALRRWAREWTSCPLLREMPANHTAILPCTVRIPCTASASSRKKYPTSLTRYPFWP